MDLLEGKKIFRSLPSVFCLHWIILPVLAILMTILFYLPGCEKQQVKEIYLIQKVHSREAIDWKSVSKAQIDIYKWNDSDTFDAYAQMVYVEGYGLICKMSCKEDNPYTQFYQDGQDVYLDSAMECFLKLGDEGYVNLETNSAGARIQQFGKNRENRVSIFDMVPGGFPVTAGREGHYWTLLIDLPLTSLKIVYPRINDSSFKKGFTFSGNFYKIGTNPETQTRHYGMWNDIQSKDPNFHMPEYFGILKIE